MASAMFIIVVILEMITSVKLAICFACLTFLFFESVFVRCLGCNIYYILKKETKYCAGGCEVSDLPKVNVVQWAVLALSMVGLIYGFSLNNDVNGELPSKIEIESNGTCCKDMNTTDMPTEHENHEAHGM